MFFNQKHLIGLLLFFLCQSAVGQDLQGLWEHTANYYKGFDVKKQQVLLAKQDSIARLLKYKPQVQLQLQQGMSSLEGSSGAFLPLAGVVNISGNSSNNAPIFNHFLSGTMNYDLLTFGKRKLDKQLGGSSVQEKVLDQRLFELGIQHKLAQRYLNLQYYAVLEDWFRKHSARYQSILQITIGLAQAGLKPGADSLLAQSALSQVQSNLSLLAGKTQGAKYLLQEFTGMELSDFSNQNAPKFMSLMHAADEQTGLHPLILLKEEEAKAQELDEKRLAKERLPRLLLLGGLSNRSSSIGTNGQGYTDYGRLYDQFANNYYVGLGITWNLQDLFKANSNQRSAQIQQRQIQQEHEMIGNELQSQVKNMQAQLYAAETGIQESNQSRLEAEKAYQLYKARYEGGLINLSELLQVQDVLLQTEKQNLSAYMDYWKLWMDLSYQQADFSALYHHF